MSVNAAAIVTIVGGNWETYSATQLINMLGGTLSIIGGRFATAGKTILRVNGSAVNVLAVTMSGVYVAGDQTVFETNGWNLPVIRGVGAGKRIKVWNADFSTLIGESINERLIASARMTSTQVIGGAGVHVVVPNNESYDIGGKYDVATGRFTPGKVGYYRVTASLRFSAIGGFTKLMFYVNGAPRATAHAITTGGAGTSLSGSAIVYLDADDYLDVRVETAGACNIDVVDNFTSQTFFEEIDNH
jgi:hypothetical protein